VGYSVRQEGEGPLETSMIHEKGHIRGVNEEMFLRRYAQDAAAAGMEKNHEKRSGKIHCGGRFRSTLSER
jgi:hypothetical protein